MPLPQLLAEFTVTVAIETCFQGLVDKLATRCHQAHLSVSVERATGEK